MLANLPSFLPLTFVKHAAWCPSRMPAPWTELLTDSVMKSHFLCELQTPTAVTVLSETEERHLTILWTHVFITCIVRFLNICHSEGHIAHIWDSSHTCPWGIRRSPEECLGTKMQRWSGGIATLYRIGKNWRRVKAVRFFTCAPATEGNCHYNACATYSAYP